MSRLNIALFLLLTITLVCSERVKINDKIEDGNMLLGYSVSVACDTFQFASVPELNKVYLIGDNEVVIAPPKDQDVGNKTVLFGMAMSAHCRDGSPVLAVSAPGDYVAIYTEKKWDEPSMVVPLKEGEGNSVSSHGDYVVYSGSRNTTDIYVVNIKTGDIQSVQVTVKDQIERHFAFSLSIKQIDAKNVLVLIGSPGFAVPSNMTTSGAITLVKGTSENVTNTLTFETIFSEVKDEVLFGQSVALSHDATFGLVGSPEIYNISDRHSKPKGFVYVIKEAEGVWKEETQLKGDDFVFYNLFGLVVSLPETHNDYAAIGTLSFKAQMRIFVLKLDSNNTISRENLYKTVETGLSIKPVKPTNPDFYTFRNYSLAMTSDTIIAGTSAYSDSSSYSKAGAVFSFSTSEIPFPNWGISVIGFSGLFIVGAISGAIYATMNPKKSSGYKKI